MHTGPLPGWNPPRTYVAALFNPLSLFAAGEQGAWYDVSDNATMFQESYGLTPAVLEQPVGLLLDKHLGLALGSEVITPVANRDFSSDTGYWVKDAGVTISGGKANWAATGPTFQLYTGGGPLTVGKYYQVTFTVSGYAQGGIRVVSGTSIAATRSADGTYTERILAGTTLLQFASVGAATTLSIDDVSCKEVLGNHVFQGTAAARPTLSARYNRLIKTEKFDDAAWTKSGLTITVDDTTAPDGTVTADKATCGLSDNVEYVSQGGAFTSTTGKFVCHVKPNSTTWCVLYLGSDAGNGIHHWYNLSGAGALGSTQLTGVGISLVTSSITAVANGFYRVSLTVTGLSTMAAFCRPVVNGDATLNSTATHTAHIWGADVRTSIDAALNIPAYQRVDTASSYDSVGFPQYLRADGVDDCMATSFSFGGGSATPTEAVAAQFNPDALAQNIFWFSVATAGLGKDASTFFRMFNGATLNSLTANDGGNNILLGDFNGASSNLWLNGSVNAIGNTGAATAPNGVLRLFTDAAGTGQFFNGRFYGGLYLDRRMTTPEAVNTSNYLAIKCGKR